MTSVLTAVPARPGVAERLAQLIRVPTVTAAGSEDAVFERLAERMRELFPTLHERLELERFGPRGLLFRWPGRSAEAPVAVLMAHLDVVPVDAGDGWAHPPFAGVVADGWVHGRGSLDDKGPLIVVLEAVENLLAAGWSPHGDVYLSFGGDEESGGTVAERIAAALHERGVAPWIVLDEGGAVVDAPLPGLDGTAAMIGVAEKGVLDLRLRALGEGGHASAPPAMTAVARIGRAVARLRPERFPVRMPAGVRRMLQVVAEHAPNPRVRTGYRALAAAPAVAARAFAARGGETAAMVRTTVAATMLRGGTAANVLPSSAEATLNLRIAIGESVAGTIARVRRIVDDPAVEVTVLAGSEPSPESPTDDARFALLAAALGDSHPSAVATPYVMMAATDGRHFHRLWPAVYRFAPLAMSAEQRATIHGVDERVEVAELERGERFMASLLQRLPERRS